MIKAILFDFDDTLVKTKEIRYKALKEAGKKFFDLKIVDQDIDKEWGKPFNVFISGVFRNIEDPGTLTEKYKSILHKYPNESIPGTNEVLYKLSQKYLLGIISSSHPHLILSGIENVGMDRQLFFFIQSSEDTNIHKPDAGVFLPSIERLKEKEIEKTEILYVGDAIDDYEASINAGLHFYGIANRTVPEKVFAEKNIPYIKEISSLPQFISDIE